ncbi:MAG: HaeIII family restriction endonuclease [Candidatus Omnitrophica bacterium]|nr:HaeIII family restriction endonuclease [Candidatus Omnitrophota bacterium]
MVAKNISNRNGRALEYDIVTYLISESSSFKSVLTQQTKNDLARDESNYLELPESLRASYDKCAKIVHDWLLQFFNEKNIVIHKITDNEAKKGDVTDIPISNDDRAINISVKHNHSAVKHQRPPTTAKWCGFSKGSSEDVGFRMKYEAIISDFLNRAKEEMPDAENFRDLKEIDDNYISENLYKPVCALMVSTINSLCKNIDNVINLFNFLVGSEKFFKIIDFPDKVKILDFESVRMPEQVEASMKGESYIILDFSNGFVLSMRLHTAASKMGKSLKFDTQPMKLPEVEEINIQK